MQFFTHRKDAMFDTSTLRMPHISQDLTSYLIMSPCLFINKILSMMLLTSEAILRRKLLNFVIRQGVEILPCRRQEPVYLA